MDFSLSKMMLEPIWGKAVSLADTSDTGVKAIFNKTVGSRFLFLSTIPLIPLVSSIDLMAGSVLGIGMILTGGTIKRLNEVSYFFTWHGGALFIELFVSTIHGINPKLETKPCRSFSDELLSYGRGMDEKLMKSKNPFKKHVLSRLIHLGTIPTVIVMRIVDFVISIFAAIGALITLGFSKKLNSLAIDNMKVLMIINDLFREVTKVINPKASFPIT